MSEPDVLQRLARLEQRVEDLDRKIDLVIEMVQKRNGYLKWTTIMIAMILSFVAAMFGLGWRPP